MLCQVCHNKDGEYILSKYVCIHTYVMYVYIPMREDADAV